MANKTKPVKPAAADKTALKNEPEQKVAVKQLLQDERTHKITGTLSLLFSFILFFAFASYLFTWQEDQDKVFLHGYKLFWGNADKVDNLLGTFGAFIAHLFIYKGFGVASFLICSFFFVVGINLIFGKNVFSVARNIKYVIIGLLVLSVLASVAMGGRAFAWGGAVGDMIKDWMYRTIGETGTLAILGVAVFAYIIWRFNPAFKLPVKKTVVDPISTDPTGEIISADESPADNEIVDDPVTGNSMKGDGAKLFIQQTINDKYAHELGIIEKDEPASVVVTPPINFPRHIIEELPEEDDNLSMQDLQQNGGDNDHDHLPLEIKVVPDKPADLPKAGSINTPYDPILDLRDYKYPQLDLLETHGSEKIVQDNNELEVNKNQIINTLKNYDITISKISATVGPTVTLYEIIPAAGVRISKIKNLEDDIALSLAALGIRIIAPIPGKGTIGIEVPNAKKTIVSMKTLLASEKFQKNNFALPIAIGKKIDNENFIVDLAAMPHLLMAGATGQGKSVGLNAILVSLLYSKHPSQLKFVLVDPKKVELSIYKTIEKHFLAKLPGEEEAIITDTKKVVHTLNALCIEMDTRYDLLKEAGCRNIREYNEKFVARKLNPEKGHQFLPFIVLVVDEFADLIMTAGKEVEMPIARLAQLARAIGIHLIIATQRPSVNIITGTIKANFPARIAFKVSSKIDSRTILDAGGAEQLIGKGDMLISYNGELVRLQCAFVDTPEVDKIVDFIGSQRGYAQAFLLPEYVDEKDMEGKDFDINDKDALFEDAARLIVTSQVGSTSLLQRRMKLGYNRAGRLMDQLEASGIVGPNQGSKAREVYIKTDADLQQHLANMG
ncbi:MAG TPA: DNA translocase FtsK [Ferruginibacter sp.]|jgi:S-DNA-T family DNA segregation ATPase FtsK/SpoIIIE|nr:DNA translocase FtsK [Ferruginibacter sp.]